MLYTKYRKKNMKSNNRLRNRKTWQRSNFDEFASTFSFLFPLKDKTCSMFFARQIIVYYIYFKQRKPPPNMKIIEKDCKRKINKNEKSFFFYSDRNYHIDGIYKAMNKWTISWIALLWISFIEWWMWCKLNVSVEISFI